MELKDLRPAEGSTKNRKRVGRGPASGTGKTAGRGMNGQKSVPVAARVPASRAARRRSPVVCRSCPASATSTVWSTCP